ncbi:hypothetical protein UY3_12096 [Chelonia mydas]|uniref:Uncharacterized protein n=1 Tax=Chelonia mydas TaxID=8469 RepID=M7BFB3_CHEMY|nr:hypothetical protein UY3_12096 [Chelonia mydas]
MDVFVVPQKLWSGAYEKTHGKYLKTSHSVHLKFGLNQTFAKDMFSERFVCGRQKGRTPSPSDLEYEPYLTTLIMASPDVECTVDKSSLPKAGAGLNLYAAKGFSFPEENNELISPKIKASTSHKD